MRATASLRIWFSPYVWCGPTTGILQAFSIGPMSSAIDFLRIRSLPGSFRARTSLRTRPDPVLARFPERAAIACRENWTVMIAS